MRCDVCGRSVDDNNGMSVRAGSDWTWVHSASVRNGVVCQPRCAGLLLIDALMPHMRVLRDTTEKGV